MDQAAAQPPPGQLRDLNNPPNQDHIVAVAVAVGLACVAPAILLRLYTNFFVTRRPKLDDGLMVLCFLGFVAYSINLLEANKFGSLVDIWNVRVEDLIKWRRLAYIQEILYLILIFTAKSLVLILYRRLFSPTTGPMTWICWSIVSVTAFNVTFYIASIFASAFRCTPTIKAWQLDAPGTCVNLYAMFVSLSALNVLSDVLMIAIPVAVICKLHMPAKRKFEVLILFTSGALTLACGLGRMIYMISHFKDSNETVALVRICLWTIGEIPACIFMSSLPMLPEMVRHLWNHAEISNSSQEEVEEAFTEMSEPSAKNSPSTTYSWSKSRERINVSDEDPYYMYDGSSEAMFSPEITVVHTVDILSIPRANDEAMQAVRPHFRPIC